MTNKQALEILDKQIAYDVELVQEAKAKLETLIDFMDAIEKNYTPYIYAPTSKRQIAKTKQCKCCIYLNEKSSYISIDDYKKITKVLKKEM